MSRSGGRTGSRGRRAGTPHRPGRKTLQLCAQVRHAVEYALSGEVDDDVLRMLHVARGDPAPDASRMIVTVVPLIADDNIDPAQILTHLHLHAGAIRSAVASAINRKKVPDLLYQFADQSALEAEAGIPRSEGDEEE